MRIERCDERNQTLAACHSPRRGLMAIASNAVLCVRLQFERSLSLAHSERNAKRLDKLIPFRIRSRTHAYTYNHVHGVGVDAVPSVRTWKSWIALHSCALRCDCVRIAVERLMLTFRLASILWAKIPYINTQTNCPAIDLFSIAISPKTTVNAYTFDSVRSHIVGVMW